MDEHSLSRQTGLAGASLEEVPIEGNSNLRIRIVLGLGLNQSRSDIWFDGTKIHQNFI